MNDKHEQKARAAFKKTKRPLKPWEAAAQETARKTERLRALRLAKEAADRETAEGGQPTAKATTGR
jgi:hypothetical protein